MQSIGRSRYSILRLFILVVPSVDNYLKIHRDLAIGRMKGGGKPCWHYGRHREARYGSGFKIYFKNGGFHFGF